MVVEIGLLCLGLKNLYRVPQQQKYTGPPKIATHINQGALETGNHPLSQVRRCLWFMCPLWSFLCVVGQPPILLPRFIRTAGGQNDQACINEFCVVCCKGGLGMGTRSLLGKLVARDVGLICATLGHGALLLLAGHAWKPK